MATAKKKTTAKKPAARTTRARTTKKTTARKSSRVKTTFLTLTPTVETVYWAILGAVVIILTIWVWHLTSKIDDIYNQIDMNNSSEVMPMPSDHKMTAPHDK